MTSPDDSHNNQVVPALAIVMIIVTGILLSGMDGTAKYLAIEFPVLFVLWGRYFFHTAITFSVSSMFHGLTFFRLLMPRTFPSSKKSTL